MRTGLMRFGAPAKPMIGGCWRTRSSLYRRSHHSAASQRSSSGVIFHAAQRGHTTPAAPLARLKARRCPMERFQRIVRL
jgi:hypothetical protein